MANGGQLTGKENAYLDRVFREWDKYFKDKEPTPEETKEWYNNIFVPSLIVK